MNGLETLQSMLGKKPSFTNQYGDDMGQPDMGEDLGDLRPSEFELKGAQRMVSGAQRSGPPGGDPKNDWMTTNRTGGPQIGVSRQELEEGAMGGLRRKLGLDRMEHQQTMDRTMGPAQVRADASVAAAEQRAAAAEQRSHESQQSAMDRLMLQLNQRNDAREDTQLHQGEMQDERLAAQGAGGPQSIPQGLLQDVTKAQTAADGQWMPGVQRWFAGGQTAKDKALTSSLEMALQKEGSLTGINRQIASGKSADEILGLANERGVPVTSLQERYIRLRAGQK